MMKRIILITVSIMLLGMVFSLGLKLVEVRAVANKTNLLLPAQGLPTITINDVSLAEGHAGTNHMVFTVTLVASVPRPTLGVNYSTADGSPPTGATQPSDYAGTSGSLIFPAGGSAQMTLSVPINGDAEAEPDETFLVNLSLIDGGAIITDGQGTGTIINDDGSACTYTIEPTSRNHPANPGGDVIEVTAPIGCSYTAASNVEWIKILGVSTGGTSYFVEANQTGAPRTGTVTIAGLTFTVNQSVCPDMLTASPAWKSFEGASGTGSFTVRAYPGCNWTAVSSESWITITSGSSGSGESNVTYTVDPSSQTYRLGRISIIPVDPNVLSGAHHINQSGGDCVIELFCAFFPFMCLETESNALNTSRNFRDQVLAKTERGQKYTRLYYQFSTEAVSILMVNPMLILRSREMLERYMPVIQSMVQGEPVALSEGDLAEIESFLHTFANKGSTALRENLNRLSEDLRDPQVHREFNITLTAGPKRETPKPVERQASRQGILMMAPFGLFSFYRKPTRN